MNGKYFFSLLILIWTTDLAFSQPYYFRRYEVERGLSTNTVYSSLQDHHGFLWFGTIDGLNRFDGYSFKVFRPERNKRGSIGNGFIISLCEDEKGNMWVGTEKGLYKYNALSESFNLVESTSDMTVTNVTADGNGNIWFIAGSLFRYDTKSGQLHLYTSKEYIGAISLTLGKDRNLWIGSHFGLLYRLNPENKQLKSFDMFSHSPRVSSRLITKIFEIDKTTLLVGTSSQGIKLFDKKSSTYIDLPLYRKNKTPVYVRDIIQYKDDEYWLATEVGLFIYNLRTKTFLKLIKNNNDPYSLSDNAIYTLCKEKEGGIWAGTFFGGLNYYPKQYNPFEKYFPGNGPNSISGSAVREICSDQYGNIWIGTEDAGLNKFNPRTENFERFVASGEKTGLSYNNIHGLTAKSNRLWIGTYENGLDLMDIRSNKIVRHYEAGTAENSLKSNFITALFKSKSGQLFVGTSLGLYSFNTKEGFKGIALNTGNSPLINSIMEDSFNNLWVSTLREGVFCINKTTFAIQHFKHDPGEANSLSNVTVNSVFEASDRTIWIATEGGGLCRFNKTSKTFKCYDTENGFPSNFVFKILEDSEKNLWISTSRGLVRFNPKSAKLNVYTRTNGLLNDQFNYNSAFKDTSSGYLYFGSVKGLIRFNPDRFIKNTFIPPVFITGFEVNNKELQIDSEMSPLKRSVLFTDTIVLRYDQSSFNIKFAALSNTSPEMTEYAYKLEGLDDDWTYLKTNRQAYFTSLIPGSYTFRVRAANSSGFWSNDKSLVIIVLPPWWKTSIAYFIYAITLFLLIWLVIRRYNNKIKERNRRKLEILTYQKEKEVYQAKIDFFTNVAHEIRTPLTLIRGPLEKIMKKIEEVPAIEKNLRIMARNTERLLQLANQLLDFRQAETNGFSLSFQEADISSLLNELYLVFQPAAEQENISLDLDLPPVPVTAYVDIEAFNKIISNLISNAIKYCKRNVIISLQKSDSSNGFYVKIKSDGEIIPPELKEKIFETFYRIKGNRRQSGTGLGLALSRSLAELMKGELILDSAENNMNVFTLYLPL